jgi:dTDP-4-dehydrorhamnose reductase
MSAALFDKVRASAPVLLIGVGGMLYLAWAAVLNRLGIPHIDPPLADLDLTQPQTIARFVNESYPLVINCAAYTDVDAAESHQAEAMAINGIGVGDLACRCAETCTFLLHYSTDYVFNGQAKRPYPVDEPRRPLNAYGHSKARGERLIEKSGCEYLIIRTSWLYAPWGKNFVRTIAALAAQRDSLKVVDDQRGRPTSALHLADASYELLQHNARGIYHVTDGGECSWFQFARSIARLGGHRCRVDPCDTAQFPRPARRPTYSVLDLSRTEALIGPMPHWQANLARVLRKLESPPAPAAPPPKPVGAAAGV